MTVFFQSGGLFDRACSKGLVRGGTCSRGGAF